MGGLFYGTAFPVIHWILVCLVLMPLALAQGFPQCQGETDQQVWWRPLVVDGLSPCKLIQQRLSQSQIVSLACCDPNLHISGGSCGPCTLQTYNLAAACLTCAQMGGATVPDASKVKTDVKTLTDFGTWQGRGSSGASLPIGDIPWLGTPASGGFFDPQAARTFKPSGPPPNQGQQQAPSAPNPPNNPPVKNPGSGSSNNNPGGASPTPTSGSSNGGGSTNNPSDSSPQNSGAGSSSSPLNSNPSVTATGKSVVSGAPSSTSKGQSQTSGNKSNSPSATDATGEGNSMDNGEQGGSTMAGVKDPTATPPVKGSNGSVQSGASSSGGTDTDSSPGSPSSSDSPSGSPKSSKSNAGAIAGGVIGAILFIVVLLVVGCTVYRRRRRARLAPSAQFMAVARPMEAYNFSSSRRDSGDLPPPFTPGAWTGSTAEKTQTTHGHRQYRDSDGMYSHANEPYGYAI